MLEYVTTIDPSLGKVRDIDLREDGSWVGVFEQGGDLHVADSYGRAFALRQQVRFPVLRAIGSERVVMVDTRPDRGTPGGLILSLAGQTLNSLSIGDGVEDVLVLDDTIVVTYFDEGVFSGLEPSDQGLAFFDLEGRLLGGYRSMFGAEAVDVADCYAACPIEGNRMAFSAYTGFELVILDPRSGVQQVRSLPERLHCARALSLRGGEVFLHRPYRHKRSLCVWIPGSAPHQVGEHEGPLRGLRNGRFLSKGEHAFTVIDCTEAN